MKSSKIISLLLLVSLILLSMTSCDFVSDIFHKHSWQDFLAKEPSCTEVGLLKKVCIKCGETEYTEINMTNHVFRDNYCIYCGGHKDVLSEIQKVQRSFGADTEGMWSMTKIYELACDICFTGSYSSFINSLSLGSLKSAVIKSSGTLSLTAQFYSNVNNKNVDLPLVLPYKSISIANPGSSLGVIWNVYVRNKTLIITYANGNEIIGGTFDSAEGSNITGFGINSANELVIFYSNNTVGFAGKISD